MAPYSGKHTGSAPGAPHSVQPSQDSVEQPQKFEPIRLRSVPLRRHTAGTSTASAPTTGATASAASAHRVRAARPNAFRHHAALAADGGKQHSKRKTLLIAVPVIAVLIAVVIGGITIVGGLFEQPEVEIQAGVAVTVIVPEGATTDEIANILKKAHVINDVQAFIHDARKLGAESLLKPGTYELTTLMDSTLLINTLVAGPVNDGFRLTIPEGLTVEQTAAVVEQSCGIPQQDFLARANAANEYLADYPFLEGAYNNSLEGFLYPKTYSIAKGATADSVIRVLLNQFALETSKLDTSYAAEHGMNLYHVITVASLIEKETAAQTERALVSSVIYNRLRSGMMLQIDATVVYALGPDYDGHPLTWEDIAVESPYNTYLTLELPAGPICSPSIESLEAAAHPSQTDYYYYVLTSKEGFHTFCTTSEEFEVAKAEYERIFGLA